MYYSVFYLLFYHGLFFISLLNFVLEVLRIGSLNIHGGRDSVKRATVYKIIEKAW